MKKIVKNLLRPLRNVRLLAILWLIPPYLQKRRNSEKLVAPLGTVLSDLASNLVNTLSSAKDDNSFANEYGAIDAVLKNQNIQDGFLVDIGAADGIRQSSTNNFLTRGGWTGALFELDAKSFSKLSTLYSHRDDIRLGKIKVHPNNILSIFAAFEIPREIDFLNIDIDSYDLSVLRCLISEGYSPKVISMEINEKFPPWVAFEVLYDENHGWKGDHFFGCSLRAAVNTLNKYGYELVNLEYNNAIFHVTQSENLNQNHVIAEFYENGYWNKVDRETLFPWNSDVNSWYGLSDYELKEAIEYKFQKYAGKYYLDISSSKMV